MAVTISTLSDDSRLVEGTRLEEIRMLSVHPVFQEHSEDMRCGLAREYSSLPRAELQFQSASPLDQLGGSRRNHRRLAETVSELGGDGRRCRSF